MDERKNNRIENDGRTMPFDSVKEEKTPKEKRPKVLFEGKLHSLIYVCVVLLICVVVSAFTVSALNDIIAISKPDVAVEVTIPEGAGTKKIAKILKKEGNYKIIASLFDVLNKIK